jgi:hypothetical protein
VSRRDDLQPDASFAGAFGAIDAKVTNSSMVKQGIVMAISGPTTEQQPVFEWKAPFDDIHRGLPPSYNFTWQWFDAKVV